MRIEQQGTVNNEITRKKEKESKVKNMRDP